MPRSHSEAIARFAAAVLDVRAAVPDGLAGPPGASAARRFAVYRNNVLVGLIEALRARFPVTERLVGAEFFRAMAREYAQAHPPRSPLMMRYGEGFPRFIACFEPAQAVPYLADVACLEAARTEAYHAADAPPLDAAELAAFDPADLTRARLALHPAVRVLRSAHPVASIWEAHQAAGEIQAPRHRDAEEVLVVRPHTAVLLQRLPAGGERFAAALRNGADVATAAEAAQAAHPQFDAGAALIQLVTAGAVTALHARPEK